MMRKSAMLLILLPFDPVRLGAGAQPCSRAGAPAGQAASSGSLRQLIPGHYVYSTTNAGRAFSSGVIATSEGAVVVDALDSEAIARAQRESISATIKQPVRYLVSSSFHDPYSKGNLAYADVFKIGHENYRAGLLDQMKRGGASAEEQRSRLPTATFRDRLTFHVGGKEFQILHFGRAHTLGDSIVFVPQDRIAYLSEVFFSEEFPNMAQGYGVSWLRVLEAVEALGADIFVPGHGPDSRRPKGNPSRAAPHASAAGRRTGCDPERGRPRGNRRSGCSRGETPAVREAAELRRTTGSGGAADVQGTDGRPAVKFRS